MPEDMPEDMSEYMPEDMPDRMPEDFPARKCINVMVGITRSKVILVFFSIQSIVDIKTKNMQISEYLHCVLYHG